MAKQTIELPVTLKETLNRRGKKERGVVASALELAVLNRVYDVDDAYHTRTNILKFVRGGEPVYAIVDDPRFYLSRGISGSHGDYEEEPLQLSDPTVVKALGVAAREKRIVPASFTDQDLKCGRPNAQAFLYALFGHERVSISQTMLNFEDRFVSYTTADVVSPIISFAGKYIDAPWRGHVGERIEVEKPLSYGQYTRWLRRAEEEQK